MSHGFPDGKFRIVNVESGQCLWKEQGQPMTVLARDPKNTVSEVWSCESGLLVSAEYESAGLGRRALDVMEDTRVVLTGAADTTAQTWEFSEGLIKREGGRGFLRFNPETGHLTVGPVPRRLPWMTGVLNGGGGLLDIAAWHWTCPLDKA